MQTFAALKANLHVGMLVVSRHYEQVEKNSVWPRTNVCLYSVVEMT